MIIEEVARRMFVRNVAGYAEPALTELAWIDEDIRRFWVGQAEAVLADVSQLAGDDSVLTRARRSSSEGDSSTGRRLP